MRLTRLDSHAQKKSDTGIATLSSLTEGSLIIRLIDETSDLPLASGGRSGLLLLSGLLSLGLRSGLRRLLVDGGRLRTVSVLRVSLDGLLLLGPKEENALLGNGSVGLADRRTHSAIATRSGICLEGPASPAGS